MRITANGDGTRGDADFEALSALLGREGITLRERRVTVIDEGDGDLALAVLRRGGAATVRALTTGTWDADALARRAGLDALPEELELDALGSGPGEGGLADVVVWWAGRVGARDTVAVLGALFHLVVVQGHVVVRTPDDGSVRADEVQRALLRAGLELAVVEVDATTVRPSLESQADAVSALAVRGARLVAYRPA